MRAGRQWLAEAVQIAYMYKKKIFAKREVDHALVNMQWKTCIQNASGKNVCKKGGRSDPGQHAVENMHTECHVCLVAMHGYLKCLLIIKRPV